MNDPTREHRVDEPPGPVEDQELALLRTFAATGARGSEVMRSLAVGAVMRGRLDPTSAAEVCGFDVGDLVPGGFEVAAASEEETARPMLSVVVPAHNEEATLGALWGRLEPVLTSIGSSEVVLVDDGSSDGTWDEICRLAMEDSRVRGLRLSRNFGHQAALSAGMSSARGEAVCFMDADLQDPPELLEQFVDLWRAGNHVVYAVRRSRRERLLKRIAYRTFYRLYRRASSIDVPLDSGDFALVDRVVIDHILELPEHNRFLRGLRSWVGYQQVGVEYDREERFAGRSNYGLFALIKLALDGILSFSAVPLRLASVLGIVVAVLGTIYTAVAVAWRVFMGGVPDGWTSTVAIILILGGMQLVVMGIVGEYIARIYDESKARPNFIIAETTSATGRT